MSKNRIKTNASLPALTRADVENLLSSIAFMKNAERAATARMDDELQAVRDRHQKPLDEIAETIKFVTAQVQQWAEANPGEFAKRKSIDFTSGTIGFRTGTPKLALLNRKWNWAIALAAVRTLMPRFIRTVPEIDKEAILAERESETLQKALPAVGLKVVQEETFYVEPNLTPLETREVAQTTKAA